MKMAKTKYKEILRETIAEHSRKRNFIRIYPAFKSDNYDKFFEHVRPFNKYIYQTLYSDYFGIEGFAKKSSNLGIIYN